MTLTIELPPELEQRLLEEAARRSQDAQEFARSILQERLAAPDVEADGCLERTPEQMLADFFARSPRHSPAELVELARQQGIQPVTRSEELLGEGPAGEDEFDVDAFLAARQEWQREVNPPGAASEARADVPR